MSSTWWAVLAASLLCYALKAAGYALPSRYLARPALRRLVETFPVALLAALLAVVTFADGQSLVLDARAAGLAVAAGALLLRAPFLVVVLAAAATAAGLRALG